MTPLMLCLESRQLEAAKILLEDYKADPNKSNSPLSPLHLATLYVYTDLVKTLVTCGAHINRVDPDSGKTALHMAVDQQEYDIVAKLLEVNADISFRDTHKGESPLHSSIRTCKNTQEM